MMEEVKFAQEPLQNDDVKFLCLLLLAASRIPSRTADGLHWPNPMHSAYARAYLRRRFLPYQGILPAERRGLLPSS